MYNMSLMRIILGSLVATTTAVIYPVMSPVETQWSQMSEQGDFSSYMKVVSLKEAKEKGESVCLMGLSFEAKIYQIVDPLSSCTQYKVGDIIPMD